MMKYQEISKHKVGVIGVPFDKGQKKPGVELGPKMLRIAKLIETLKEIEGLDVKDFGDVTYTVPDPPGEDVPNMHNLQHVSACNKALSAKVGCILNEGRICLTLGGDHSIGIGSIDGHYNFDENVVVLWVDAHADINTNKTSESGSVHGMPLALVAKELREYWPPLPGMEWLVPRFSIRNLAYIGLRSIDRYERVIINKFGIPAFGMEEVERIGVADVVKLALHYLDPRGEKSIHVSFDIDSLDMLEAPSTGTCVRGGLTLREGILIMEQVYNTGRLAVIDLVEVNPLIGTLNDSHKTVEAAIHVIKAALGFSRRGTIVKGDDDIPKMLTMEKLLLTYNQETVDNIII